jgi:Tol biopolymer transport system component
MDLGWSRAYRRVGAAGLGCVAAVLFTGSPAAHAAYPGGDGLIVYSSVDSNGTPQIFTLDPATGAQRQLTTTGGADPSWSPYGTQIAFDRGEDIWLMRPDGSGQHDITNTPNVQESDPTWSPDGKRIAYAMVVSGGTSDIAVMSAAGKRPTPITTDPSSDTEPAWSTKNVIAFVSKRTGNQQIWTMRPTGAQQTDVSNDTAVDGEPAWSPDGTTIVYSGAIHQGSIGGDLWTMAANGTHKTPIVHQNGYGDGDYPSWSPDGSTLEFSANNGLGALRLWTYSLQSGVQTQLTHEATQPYDRSGDWQPVRVVTLSLSATSVERGAQVTVTGTGFAPKETVRLQLTHGPQSFTLANVAATSDGDVNAVVTIPSTAPVGKGRVVGTGTTSRLVASHPITVT